MVAILDLMSLFRFRDVIGSKENRILLLRQNLKMLYEVQSIINSIFEVTTIN